MANHIELTQEELQRRIEILKTQDFYTGKSYFPELNSKSIDERYEDCVEQIRGIVEVFSPEGQKSEITYCPEKPSNLQNAFDMTKTFTDFPTYRPQYSYIEQLRDFKKEMEEEPMAQLWGRKEDYTQ